jgi:hypothetical protein
MCGTAQPAAAATDFSYFAAEQLEASQAPITAVHASRALHQPPRAPRSPCMHIRIPPAPLHAFSPIIFSPSLELQGTMAPFGNASVPNDFDFFNSLPPLDSPTAKRSPESCSFLPEPVEAYCLAVVDDSGEVVRAATAEDLLQLKLLEDTASVEPAPQRAEPKAETVCPDAYFKELLSKGPVCRHCGVQGK